MSTSTPPKQTVLVVNDYEPHMYALSRQLEAAGFQVLKAGTGTEALHQVADRPDAVLLDVGLPDVNGFEVCRRIKADPATADIPVVFLSATYQNAEAVTQGDSVGAAAFLFHPVDVQTLTVVISGSVAKKNSMPPVPDGS